MNNLNHAYYNSPIGLIHVIASNSAIARCSFVKQKSEIEHLTPFLNRVLEQFDEYFQGRRLEFNLALTTGGTNFQRKVWQALQSIPYGTTITYKELAEMIDQVKAIRAVASANAKNPISLIIPCHRVIGSDGKLHGYGGGLEKKGWLIDFENKYRIKQESEKALK